MSNEPLDNKDWSDRGENHENTEGAPESSDDSDREASPARADSSSSSRRSKASGSESSRAKSQGTTGPADRVPGLQNDAESRDLYSQSSYLRDWLLADNTFRGKNVVSAVLATTLVFIGFVYVTGQGETLAQDLFARFYAPDPVVEISEHETEAPAVTEATEFALGEMPNHPDRLFQPYTSGELLQADVSEDGTSPLISQFRRQIDMYATRQGEDSNFDIRLFNNQNFELLEVYTLESEKQRFIDAGEPSEWNWGEVDRARAQIQRELVDKYVQNGIPRDHISVRWGRANQIAEARTRHLPYLEHEINLANYLGLSVLVTQLGVIETFNQDGLVSPVGARGRYQMMPFILRESQLHQFNVPTAAGNTIQIKEERHPMLQMEPAFYLLRGYINAVGHELPGISAYHTGPGNVFMVLRQYLTNASEHISPSSTVMEGYMWAITEGFDTVSSGTSFGRHSRGYVTSAYGSLRAKDDVPIDTSQTFQADRVELRGGETIQLSQLLRALQSHDLHWGYDTDDLSTYEQFARMNPHFRLPSAEGGGTPVRGDVRLSASASGNPIRFFLPIGAVEILKEQGLDIFDEGATFRYDRNSFPEPDHRTKTMWDRQYEQLVENIGNFGFTEHNRRVLRELAAKFDELAEQNPTHYRLAQQRIIDIHQRLWLTRGWRRLADATSTVLGTERQVAQPPALHSPSPLGTTDELVNNDE